MTSYHKSDVLQVDAVQMAQHDTVPLIEVELRLVADDVVWAPELHDSSSTTVSGISVQSTVEGWLAGFRDVGTLVSRLDSSPGTAAFSGAMRVTSITPRMCLVADASASLFSIAGVLEKPDCLPYLYWPVLA